MTTPTPPAPLGELSSERLRELIKGQNKLWHGRAVNDHEDILRLLNSELARREGLRGEPSRDCSPIANAIADAKVRLFGRAVEIAERIRSGLAEPPAIGATDSVAASNYVEWSANSFEPGKGLLHFEGQILAAFMAGCRYVRSVAASPSLSPEDVEALRAGAVACNRVANEQTNVQRGRQWHDCAARLDAMANTAKQYAKESGNG